MRQLIFLLFLVTSINCYSQFTSINQPVINNFYFAEISDDYNVCLAGGPRVIKSVDTGYNWEELPLGNFGFPVMLVEYLGAAVISSNEYFMIGKDVTNQKSILIKTVDGGLNWSLVFETLNGSAIYFTDIVFENNTLIITSRGKVHISYDYGQTWIERNVGNFSYTSKFLNYIPNSNTWFTAYETNNNFHISTNNGDSWSPHAIPSITGILISKVNNKENEVYLTKSSLNTSYIYVLDDLLNIIDTIQKTEDQTNQFPMIETNKLNDGNYITCSLADFMFIDSTNEQHYFYTHHLINYLGDEEGFNDLELGANFGIAVGPFGAISRLDLNVIPDLYVPALFDLNYNNCPNGQILATPYYSYADSYAWYLDGQLISSDSILNYTMSNIPGSHSLSLTTTYQGNTHEFISYFTTNQLTPPPTYNVVFNSTPCYNTSINVSFQYQSGNVSLSTVQVYLDSQSIYGPTTLTGSNFSVPTPTLTNPVVLTAIFSKSQTCGISYDTLTYTITPEDNLLDNFTVQPHSGLTCNNQSPIFQLNDLVPNNTYTVECDYLFNYSDVFYGSNSSTHTITGPPKFVTPSTETYGYFTIHIADNQGCQVNLIMDSTFFIDPLSSFDTNSDSYYKDDTVHVINYNPKNNRQWSVTPNDLIITNIIDTVPNIVANNYGIHQIDLTNTPFQNCTSTRHASIHISDSMPLMDIHNSVLQNSLDYNLPINLTIDHEGSSYELCYISASNIFNTHLNQFLFIKRDTDGNLLWSKTHSLDGYNLDGMYFEEMDIDPNGDIYAAITIQSGSPSALDLISYTPFSYPSNRRLYIVKFDGSTGQMTWFVDLTQQYGSVIMTGSLAMRINDLIVTENRIYFALSSSNKFVVGCLDNFGNYVDHSYVNLIGPGEIPKFERLYCGNNRSVWMTPKLELHPDGSILLAGYYTGSMLIENSSTYILSASQRTLFIGKYTENLGFSDFKNLIEFQTYDNGTNQDRPYTTMDSEGNYTIAFSWDRPGTKLEGVLDSLEKGTMLVQLDGDLNINWIMKGSYIEIHDLKCAQASGDVYLLGRGNDNFSIGNNQQSMMVGDYYYDDLGNIGMPIDFLKNDLFIVSVSSNSIPLAGTYFKHTNPFSPAQVSQHIKSKFDVTPCGDICLTMVATHADYQPILIIENTITLIDEPKFLKFTVSESNEDCTFLSNISDTVYYCTQADSVLVNLGEFYNLDSISYYYESNGNQSTEFTIPLTSSIWFELPDTLIQKIVISSPIIKEYILAPLLVNYTINFTPTICEGTIQTFVGLPSSNQFLYNNFWSTDNYNMTTTFYSDGLNNIPVKITNTAGCIAFDTLTFYVNLPTEPEVLIEQNNFCYGDTVIILSDENATVFSGINISTITNDTLVITPNEYSVGQNSINYSLIDTNNCSFNSQLSFNILEPISPDFQGINPPFCNEIPITIIGESGNNLFWTNSQTFSDTLNFTPFNDFASDEQYNFPFTFVDTNSCQGQGAIYIEVYWVDEVGVMPYYNLNCGSSLIFDPNSWGFTSSSWTLNGLPSSNVHDETNLNIGENFIDLTVTTNEGCTVDTSFVINYCDDLSIGEESHQDLILYPNPASHEINIESDNELIEEILMYDENGKMVWNRILSTKKATINSSNLITGVYILNVITTSNSSYFKVIIQN